MKTFKALAGGALALTLLATPALAAPAAPHKAAVEAGEGDAAVTQVHSRRRGWGPGVGIGLGILGGVIIANELYRPRRDGNRLLVRWAMDEPSQGIQGIHRMHPICPWLGLV